MNFHSKLLVYWRVSHPISAEGHQRFPFAEERNKRLAFGEEWMTFPQLLGSKGGDERSIMSYCTRF